MNIRKALCGALFVLALPIAIRSLLLFATFAAVAIAAPGDLDPTYGTAGLAPLRIGKSQDVLYAVAVQADGKVVSVGLAENNHPYMAVMRHLPDGTLDAAFGNGGRALPGYPDAPGEALGVEIQADGKIVIAGVCNPPSPSVCLKRLLPDGSLDAGFSPPMFPSGSSAVAAMAAQADGKLVLAWHAGSGLDIARFTGDGVLDATFGAGGVVSVTSSNEQDAPCGLAIQGDGKILVIHHASISRLMPDGTSDASFGVGGTANSGGGTALALQSDGKIVVATTTSNEATVMRLLANGDPDPAFSGDGIAPVPYPAGFGSASAIAVQTDGRIVMAGTTVDSGSSSIPYITAFRVDGTGAPDTSLGPGGVLRLAPSTDPTGASGNAITVGGSGAVLVGGVAGGDFQLFQLLPEAALDTTFAGDGGVSTDFGIGGPGGFPLAMRAMSDGHLVPLTTEGVARVMPDGTPDVTFGDAGTIGFSDHFATLALSDPQNLAVQADGKILVAGQRGQFAPYQRRMIRLNADGTLDTGFASAAIGGASIELLADGRIFTVDVAPPESAEPSKLARMLPDGTPDAAFWTSGVKTLDPPLSMGTLARDASGMWILGGIFGDQFSQHQFAAARMSQDGIYDATFGSNGRFLAPVLPNLPSAIEVVRSLAQPDGSTILVGMATATVDSRTSGACRVQIGIFTALQSTLVVLRIDTHGALDTSFGLGGYVATRLGGYDTVAQDATIDAAGRILVAGSRQPSAGDCSDSAFVARFSPWGALDPGFGSGGVAYLPFPTSATVGWFGAIAGGLAALPDGSIAGFAKVDHPVSPLVTFRMEGGGSLPSASPPGDLDADGIPDAVESSVGRDPIAKDNDIFGDARLFAMQQYRDFLGREGDAGGVDFWTNQLSTGAQTRAQMAETFYNSPEFQGQGAPVVRLYFAYFLRIPDYDGLQYWMGRFRSGDSLDGISNLFATSPEFVATYGSLDNAAFVDRVYRNVLGRAPDSGGLAFWTGQLDGGMTRGEMMTQFSESAEYQSLIRNEVYVTMMYVGMLRRSPDSGGFSYWVGYLDAGNSGLALTSAFVAAPEYRARFLP
jgi:uncharacterized delta-60 repeat protein